MGKMNLTDLHYVVEIDKSGSISKAVKELYVAQPNLSKAIKHLEREFGISKQSTVLIQTLTDPS